MSSIDTRQKLIYGDGALQKASLTYKNAQTGREVTLPVQFNPTEYSISRDTGPHVIFWINKSIRT